MSQGGTKSGGLFLRASTATTAGGSAKQPVFFLGSLPFWGAEATTPPVSDPFAPIGRPEGETSPKGSDARATSKNERGCRPMARFARIAAALSTLATILLVTGASTKY